MRMDNRGLGRAMPVYGMNRPTSYTFVRAEQSDDVTSEPEGDFVQHLEGTTRSSMAKMGAWPVYHSPNERTGSPGATLGEFDWMKEDSYEVDDPDLAYANGRNLL